jgi:hypothetical protein
MWGYQLHNRPILDTLIQPSETSSSNYQRLSRRSRETRVRKWLLNFADEHLLCSYGSFTCRKSTTWDRRLYFPSEGRRATDFITLKIHRPRPSLNPRTLGLVAIPSDSNAIQKETEKKWRYKILIIEINRIWNMKRSVISVIIGASGPVTKGLQISVNNIRKAFSRFSTKKEQLY